MIHGKCIEKDEIKKALNDILQEVDEKDFSSVFCGRYGYEEIPYTVDIVVDYIIDLDTYVVL